MRLQKYLSRAGVASRRKSEGLIASGRVRVNGEVVTAPGTRVDPERDRVAVDGREVEPEAPRWILLHKPRDVVTTLRDPRGRPTVFDLLPGDDPGALRYVGRLDMDSEGLLLLTNRGDAIHALTHPSGEVPREYHVLVRERPGPEALERLREGVELADGPARASEARILRDAGGGEGWWIAVVVHEGRKREVRRMLDAVGHPLERLRRVRFGPIELGELPPGEWRPLEADEVRALRRAAGLE